MTDRRLEGATAQATVDSPVGPLTIVASDGDLLGVYFEDHRRRPELDDVPERADHPVIVAASTALAQYFEGASPGLPPMRAPGTAFQQDVWRALAAIPPGETRTYGEVAAAVGRPSAVRAVGAAIGANPVSILVPCHRVIGADGSITGYAGGVERKRALLALEQSSPPRSRR